MRIDIPESVFDPFYDTTVAICGKRDGGRELRGSCKACVFVNGYDDPLSAATDGTNRRSAIVWVRRAGDAAWFDATPPQKRDRVTIDNVEFAVESVDLMDRAKYALNVREVA